MRNTKQIQLMETLSAQSHVQGLVVDRQQTLIVLLNGWVFLDMHIRQVKTL
jgi:hypothetical protein